MAAKRGTRRKEKSGDPVLLAEIEKNRNANFWTQFGRFLTAEVVGARKDFMGAVTAGCVLPLALFIAYVNKSLFWTELLIFVGIYVVGLGGLLGLASAQTQRIYTRVTPTLTYFVQVTAILGGFVAFVCKALKWPLS